MLKYTLCFSKGTCQKPADTSNLEQYLPLDLLLEIFIWYTLETYLHIFIYFEYISHFVLFLQLLPCVLILLVILFALWVSKQ